MSWLIAGLGNPEPRYAGHRHNIGFMVVDELARRTGASFREKFKGRLTKAMVGQRDAWLLEPMTFMNRSGISLGAAGAFYGIGPDETVVVHDELDLPFGAIRVKVGGGHGGHNGLRSIFSHFGRDFVRVRCGIGRPPHGDVSNFVLSNFNSDEQPWLRDVIDAAADAVHAIMDVGPKEAQSRFNGQSFGPSTES
jgi:peptidyl-tRNA hydrolase, PTH1 family